MGTNGSNSANNLVDNEWLEIKDEAVSACRSSLVVGGVESGAGEEQILGRRAHITLGCAEGVKAFQTGLDQLSLLNMMGEGHVVEGLLGGSLIRCGDQGWVIRLKKKIKIQAVFTGVY